MHTQLPQPRETPVVYTCEYDRDLPPGIRFGPVIRDLTYIECNTAGYGSVIINDREFPVGPGDCYFILPGSTVTYTTHPQTPREGVWCSVDGLAVEQALHHAGISEKNPFAPRALFPQLAEQIQKLARMSADTDPGAPLRRTACIYAFLGVLLSGSVRSDSNHWLDGVIGYMESNYYKPLSVEMLAKVAFLERSYFSVRFKALTGKTPHGYLTALRVQKACVLMAQTGCTVAAAAELVGLAPGNFARVFRRETGQAPKSYKTEKTALQAAPLFSERRKEK